MLGLSLWPGTAYMNSQDPIVKRSLEPLVSVIPSHGSMCPTEPMKTVIKISTPFTPARSRVESFKVVRVRVGLFLDSLFTIQCKYLSSLVSTPQC